MTAEDGSELHPIGYHTKETCLYMKAKFQFDLTDITQKMTGLYPNPKAFVPFGGSSAPKMASSAPVPAAADGECTNRWGMYVRDSPDEVPLEKTRKCRVRVVHGSPSHDCPLRCQSCPLWCQSEGSYNHFPFGIEIYVAMAESLLWIHHLSHNAPITD